MPVIESIGVSLFILVVVFLVLVSLCFCIHAFTKLIPYAMKTMGTASKRTDGQANKN